MKQSALLLLLTPAIVLAQSSHFIQTLPSSSTNTNSTLNINSIVEQAYGPQLSAMQQQYRNIRVKAIYNNSGIADHLIVIKNKKHVKGFTIDRINLDKNHTVVKDYTPTAYDDSRMAHVTTPVCPASASNVNFVVSSYYYSEKDDGPAPPAIATSPSLDEIVASAKAAGYNVKTLFDKDATAQNILNYLSCPNVKLYHDTGDGAPEDIETSTGWLSSADMDKYLKNKLQGKVIKFNDCSVADKKDPKSVEKIIMKNGAQAFIGGVTLIETITTDQAAACFWHQALQGKNMKDANQFCQSQYDYGPNEGGDGIVGYFSNGDDTISGIKTPLKQQAWGALSAGNPTSTTTPLGKALNSKNGDDENSANSAATTAQNNCKQQGGTNCSLRHNHIQFQNCASIVPSQKTVYFGFGVTTKIAESQAMGECKQDTDKSRVPIVDPTKCAAQPIWSGCN
jgi:hypothetical protein